jgi:alkylation response protein AidB-like acyl-CoA dehydrogenase
MRFELSDEHKMLREVVREFRENEIEPLVESMDPASSHPPIQEQEALREKAKEVGLWGVGLPEELGGEGMGALGRAIITEEMSKHRMGIYSPFLESIDLFPGIHNLPRDVSYFSEYQKEKYLLPSIEGEKEPCFALTEPAAGSDPSNMRTVAEKDGDEWVIDGQKHYITAAGYRDFAAVFAKAIVDGEERGVTCFLVDTDMDGWSIRREHDSIRDWNPYEIDIDGLRLSDRQRVGEVGEGLEIASSGIRESRIMYAAVHIGVATHALERAIDHAKQRETFGKTLSERQGIRWMIAQSAVDIHTSRLAVYDCAWKADNGYDTRHEASIIKLNSSEMLKDVIDRVLQIHGGAGVMKDLPVERWYREARVRRIGEGPSEIHKRTIARNLIKGYEPVDLLDKTH